MISNYRKICKRCFGRCFALDGHGESNLERGDRFIDYFKTLSSKGYEMVGEDECQFCNGIFLKFQQYFDMIQRELSEYEFDDFLVGSTFDDSVISQEKEIQEIFQNKGESIKKEFNREFGKFISEKTGKKVNFKEPEIMIRMDMRYDSFSLQVKSLFVSGFYRKLVRGIPQTRWIHRGPSSPSVETIIGNRINLLAKGTNFFLHGAGREDVDVLMLGNGREFAIEVENPKRRKLNLYDLESLINGSGDGVEVFGLKPSSKESVVMIKAEKNDKTYRLGLKFPTRVDKTKLKILEEKFSGKDIYQRTPLRVSSRRSDLVRKRTIRKLEIEDSTGNEVTLLITAESGTYIKELVHGDDGRTEPSISGECEEMPEILYLDVVEIHRENE
ncbi:MAG: tRNA pseudouridine(54/55) synthase Pus10 [Candidatus Thermoplasmatota archaeon]|nr:tRNA pseudouridine(54/55) synthase Pus10 [Candidatus Thermoplasmatota archaeon]MCL5988825.1 tRNA pseudouridine(54/55) synthase Pus10 [Candidatus Thermoplasmatota archaeon]